MTPGRSLSPNSARAFLWMLPLVLLLALPARAAEPAYPALTGRVVDDAGVLDAATVENLTATLAKHQQATGEQVVVVTLKSLQGYSIEDFGYQLGRHWGIGQKGSNTGVLLIVAPNQHKVRIEVGYGLEGRLTDATSRTIIENDILPAFRSGDFNAGITAGVTAILKVLGGGSTGEAAAPDLSPTVSPGLTAFAGLLALIFLSLLVNRVFRKRDGIYRRVGRTSSIGGFGGDDFGSSGGGFFGGGGSFGGGGASGSW